MRVRTTLRGLIVDEGRLNELAFAEDEEVLPQPPEPVAPVEPAVLESGSQSGVLVGLGLLVAAVGIPSDNELLRTAGWVAGGLTALSLFSGD